MAVGRILVIAGSDCSGGAGLEADQKVIAAHKCYAMTATTALTIQNTLGVKDFNLVPPPAVTELIKACLDDIGADVVKTGMLASAETIKAVVETLGQYKIQNIVVDPVMVATTGSVLLPKEAVGELRNSLLPLTTILTPNIPEAQLLLGDAWRGSIEHFKDIVGMAQGLRKLGPRYVLVKGGHVPFRQDGHRAVTEEEKKRVINVLAGPNEEVVYIESPYFDSKNTHGTGCSLASAIASNLALGYKMVEAAEKACYYVEAGIKTAPGLGKGNGPINHFHSMYSLPFAPGRFMDYILRRPDVQPAWQRYINHPFVIALGNGTLPLESFKGYLMQDYAYLIQFARANALAAYKASNMDDIAASAAIVTHIRREMDLHIKYCEGFGILQEEMEKVEEHTACTAYSRYVLDIGQSQDWIGLQMALAPCLHGYYFVAKQLHESPASKREDNPYWTWVLNYVADDYVAAYWTGVELLEKHAQLLSPHRIEELVKIFIHATKMEITFWEMFPSASTKQDGIGKMTRD